MTKEERRELQASLSAFPGGLREETEGLSFEQMTFAALEPGWARWSIDNHLRHVAQIPANWLYVRTQEAISAAGYFFPPTAEAIAQVRRSGPRLVPPHIAPDRKALLDILTTWMIFCCWILDREEDEGLRKIQVHLWVDPDEKRPDDPRKTVEYTRDAAALHPSGYIEDPQKPGHFTVELGTALCHIHWNMLAHHRNIQRIKTLLGLPEAIDLPRVGYLSLPKYYD